MEYYIKSNALRPLKIDGINYAFEEVDQTAGTSWGVFATEDQKIIEAFDAKGVSKINQFEYERLLQKKSSQSRYSVEVNSQVGPPKQPRPPLQNQEQPTSPQAKVTEKSSDPVAEDDILADLVQTKPVEADAEESVKDESPKFVSKMSDLAEILGVEEHIIREYLKDGPDSLKRDAKKGYNVEEWSKLLAE